MVYSSHSLCDATLTCTSRHVLHGYIVTCAWHVFSTFLCPVLCVMFFTRYWWHVFDTHLIKDDIIGDISYFNAVSSLWSVTCFLSCCIPVFLLPYDKYVLTYSWWPLVTVYVCQLTYGFSKTVFFCLGKPSVSHLPITCSACVCTGLSSAK